MTKALEKDPQALLTVLRANRMDLLSRIDEARGNTTVVATLKPALLDIEEAIKATTLLLAEEGDEDEASSDSQEPRDEPLEEDDEEELVDESTGEPVDELGESPKEEIDSPDKAELLDEPEELREELTDAPPPEVENPVEMSSRLRKDMGDLAADMLDDYGKEIFFKVKKVFDAVLDGALNLGTEEQPTSLREELLIEVGRKGYAQLEPHFEEWRLALLKDIMKDVTASLQPPEPDPVEELEEVADQVVDELPDAVELAPVEEEAPAEESTEEQLAELPVSSSVSLQPQRVSFTMKNIVAAGRKSIRLE